MDRVFTEKVFIALAKTSSLIALDFRLPITAKLISKAVAERIRVGPNSQLLGRLKKLVCVAESEGIARLLPHLFKLVHLEVNIKGGRTPSTRARDLFPDLFNYCLKLRTLKIVYLGAETIRLDPRMFLKFIQKYWSIETLEISGKKVVGEEFLSPFLVIMQSAKQLRNLRLSFQCDLTETALLAAAAYKGKRLAELDIGGNFDFDRLISLFNAKNFSFGPQFRLLGIGKLATPPVPAEELPAKANDFAQLLKAIAPQLEDFNILTPDTFSDRVEKHLNKMLSSVTSEEGILARACIYENTYLLNN
ncbi:hypothetical protein F4781DRAFT_411555 [Annulohypoxylon bovei var. microspora]|nr:hypothetical protein F4781DRAFT_411555 [Annulohypoxylon bovei var. microspora]